VAVDESDFDLLGADFDATGKVRTGLAGSATCRLMRQRDAVDFAVCWLVDNR
jgi:aminoglycoside 3-N-acetyltransferase